MKVKAFLILMVVTVATVMISATLGERWFNPGLERAVFIGIVTCLVVFPLSRFFEHIGWVKGSWNVAGDKDTAGSSPAAMQAEADERADAAKVAAKPLPQDNTSSRSADGKPDPHSPDQRNPDQRG